MSSGCGVDDIRSMESLQDDEMIVKWSPSDRQVE